MGSNIRASVQRDERKAEMRAVHGKHIFLIKPTSATQCHLIVADGKGHHTSSHITSSSSFTPVSMCRLFLPRWETPPVHALETEEPL